MTEIPSTERLHGHAQLVVNYGFDPDQQQLLSYASFPLLQEALPHHDGPEAAVA